MIQFLSSNTKAWLHGLFAAAISAFSTSASGIIMLPTVFNFSHDGIINMIKVSGGPALFAAFSYLKQSPLPGGVFAPGDTADIKDPVISADGTISGTSATLQKAPNSTSTPEVPK